MKISHTSWNIFWMIVLLLASYQTHDEQIPGEDTVTQAMVEPAEKMIR